MTAAPVTLPIHKPWYKSLYFQVIVAITLGIAFGAAFPSHAVAMKPLADGFIKLIKMLIAPIVFCTVVIGITGMRNMKIAGRVGFKALVYFEVMTTLALVIGLVVANGLKPGAGMHIDPASLDSKSIEIYATKAAEHKSAVDFFLNIIPTTIADAFTRGDLLQILLISILFAVALISIGNRGYALTQLIQQVSDMLFAVVGFIVKLSPLGAFGAMAFTVGQYGLGSLGSLLELMLTFYLTCILFIGLGLGLVMRLCGFRIWQYLKYIKEEIFIVLGTSSSEAALPNMIEKMIKFGCARPIVSMVVPTGYSFNLDGTCIYLTMAALFIAQATGIDLTLTEELTLLAVLLLTSKGAAGVTGSGFIVLAGTLAAVGRVPVEGMALILGIDRFMSEARAITNLIGNGVATIVVARWEKAIDEEAAQKALNPPAA
jgi:aerobic C4-dicarboxylate transport protein